MLNLSFRVGCLRWSRFRENRQFFYSDGEHTSAEDENPEEEETSLASDTDKDADQELEGQESEEQEPDPDEDEDLFGACFLDDPKTPQEEPEKETR